MLLGIFSLIVLALVGWFGFTYVLKRRFNFSFTKTPVRTLTYFLVLTGIAGVLLPEAFFSLYGTLTFASITFLVLTLGVVSPVIYAMARGRGREDAHQDLEFLRLDARFLLSKPGDVIFQQTVFGSILLLASLLLPVPYAIGAFAVLFALFHAVLFMRLPHTWALYFLLSSLVLSFPLAYLLLFIPGGIYYAIGLHMLWYVLGGALLGRRD